MERAYLCRFGHVVAGFVVIKKSFCIVEATVHGGHFTQNRLYSSEHTLLIVTDAYHQPIFTRKYVQGTYFHIFKI